MTSEWLASTPKPLPLRIIGLHTGSCDASSSRMIWRTLSKAIYPGYWDVAAGGMVLASETYAESAARELEEELGVSGVELIAHDHFFFEDTGNRLWCSAFSAVWDGPLILQPEEVLEARFIPVDQVMLEIEQKPYCPDSLAALKRYLKAQQSNVAKPL